MKQVQEQTQVTIKLSDFTDSPGGRYRKDGPKSAEEWRDDHILPALTSHDVVVVDMDAEYNFCPSALEEVFGGLVRKLGAVGATRIRIASSDPEPKEGNRRIKMAQKYFDEELRRQIIKAFSVGCSL